MCGFGLSFPGKVTRVINWDNSPRGKVSLMAMVSVVADCLVPVDLSVNTPGISVNIRKTQASLEVRAGFKSRGNMDCLSISLSPSNSYTPRGGIRLSLGLSLEVCPAQEMTDGADIGRKRRW